MKLLYQTYIYTSKHTSKIHSYFQTYTRRILLVKYEKQFCIKILLENYKMKIQFKNYKK